MKKWPAPAARPATRARGQSWRTPREPIVDQLGADLTVTEGDRIFITDHFTLAILGHISQWIATGMSADPYILTERIARILDGQVLRALTRFSEKPTAAPGRA